MDFTNGNFANYNKIRSTTTFYDICLQEIQRYTKIYKDTFELAKYVFGVTKEFHRQQKRDRNVRDCCKVNNIKLLEISYLQYPIIEQLLDVVFEKNKNNSEIAP